jgi:hypothetical protein
MFRLLLIFLFLATSEMAFLHSSDILTSQEYCIDCKPAKHGPPGPTGPRGPTGPPGPPGMSCSSTFLSVFLKAPTPGGNVSIAPGDNVIFNQFLIPIQGSAVSYNDTTGVFTFNETGFYKVTYGVSSNGSDAPMELLLSGSIVHGSAFDVTLEHVLSTISVIIEATASQTLQLVNGSTVETVGLGAAYNIGGDSPTPSVIAFLTIKQL